MLFWVILDKPLEVQKASENKDSQYWAEQSIA